MKNRTIKTFEEFSQKIEIEDSTVHFHFGNGMENDVIKSEPEEGDEVMVNLPLIKLNHMGNEEPQNKEPEYENPEEIENLENPSYDIQNLEDEEGEEEREEEREEDSDYQEEDESDEDE
jgi:hypothetical protein